MICDILTNIISDILTIILFAFVSWLILSISRRNRLLKFFGIEKSRRIVIYISNLNILPFGARGIDNHVRSYSGSAGPYQEILAANGFRDLFNYLIPSLAGNPGILGKLLISDVQVQQLLSPIKDLKIEESTSIITLGSPAFNSVSKYVEASLRSKAQFKFGVIDRKKLREKTSKDNETPQFPPSGMISGSYGTADYMLFDPTTDMSAYSSTAFEKTNNVIPVEEQASEIIYPGRPPYTDPNIGFIERIFDNNNGRVVLYVAGLSEDSTANATNYLRKNWQSLYKKHTKKRQIKDFMVILHFDKPGDRHPTILFEC